MPKEAVFTIKLENDLRERFIAAAQAAQRPASQVVRELMREFILREQEKSEYETFMAQKVEKARADLNADKSVSHDEVEAAFAARRARAGRKG